MARSATTTKAQVEPEDTNPDPPAPAEASAENPAPEKPSEAKPTHVVLRSFYGGGATRVVGEVVCADSWRMVDHLVNDRRLRVLTREDPEPVSDGQGRFFVDDDALLAFIDSDTHEEN